MQSKASTVQKYLAELPDDRRSSVEAVRKVILKNLDSGFEEGMQYGMIGYYVPHRNYPPGYHCDPKQPLPYAGLASQKNHLSLYLMSLYGESDLLRWFEDQWARTGKKLDMGKCCIRFKRAEDLALDVIAEALRRVSASKHIEYYEDSIRTMNKRAVAKSETAKDKLDTKSVSKKAATSSPATGAASKSTAKKVAKKSAKKASKKVTSRVSTEVAKKSAKKVTKRSTKKTR